MTTAESEIIALLVRIRDGVGTKSVNYAALIEAWKRSSESDQY